MARVNSSMLFIKKVLKMTPMQNIFFFHISADLASVTTAKYLKTQKKLP